jgi:hypothetical protein
VLRICGPPTRSTRLRLRQQHRRQRPHTEANPGAARERRSLFFYREQQRSPILNLVLGFAPFVLFALLARLSLDLALWLSFATAFAIGIHGFLSTRVLKVLDLCSIVIFGLLALFRGFLVPELGVSAIRLVIDISLFVVAVASLVARRPFTLQYALGEVPADVFASPSFVRANYLITLVWMAAFAVMGTADGAATFDPSVPLTDAVAAGLLTLAGALAFTWRYPDHVSRRIQGSR